MLRLPTPSRPPCGMMPVLLVLALALSCVGPATAFDDTAADRAALTQGLLVRGPSGLSRLHRRHVDVNAPILLNCCCDFYCSCSCTQMPQARFTQLVPAPAPTHLLTSPSLVSRLPAAT